MKLTPRWGALPLVFFCYIVETIGSQDKNDESLNLPVTGKPSGCNCSVANGTDSIISAVDGSETGNILRSIIQLSERNETYDGFEFVDSPEILSTVASESGEKFSTSDNRSGIINDSGRGGGGMRVGEDGIERNSWQAYANGTIIHDVRISIVHPGNMVEIVKGSNDSSQESTRPSHRFSGRKSEAAAPGDDEMIAAKHLNRSMNDEVNNGTMKGLGPRLSPNDSYNTRNTIDPAAILSSTPASNTSDKGEPVNNDPTLFTTSIHDSPPLVLDKEPPPVENTQINVNGPCFDACLAKCLMTDSNPIPKDICLPCPGKSTRDDVSNLTSEDDAHTTDVVPILILGQRGILHNFTDPNSEMASGIKMLKAQETNEHKLGLSLEDICLSERCVLKAADIIGRLEHTVNPCDSFYKFACGGYLKNGIPDGRVSRSVFSDISSDIRARIKSVLSTPIVVEDSLPVILLKQFYKKCKNYSLEAIYNDTVTELGGYPQPDSPIRVPQQMWGEIAYNWTFGWFLEYNLVTINLTRYRGDTWMLNTDYPLLVRAALANDTDTVLNTTESLLATLMEQSGVDNSSSRRILADMRLFVTAAIKYARTNESNVEEGVFSLGELKTRFVHLDVFKNLPSLLKNVAVIGDDEMIYVSNIKYLSKIDDLLRDSTVRTQASHLVLNTMHRFALFVHRAYDTNEEEFCAKLTGKLFPHLANHLYASKFVSPSKVATATTIAAHIRDSFLKLLDEDVDETTKNKVIRRINQLMFTWNHRYAMNDDLKGIVLGFEENPSLLGYIKTGMRNLKTATYSYLHQRVNSSLVSFMDRYLDENYGGVNAYYFSQNVLIPSSALHDNFLDLAVPTYVSYGGLGFLVGHELLHGIAEADDISNTSNYRKLEQCLIQQADEFAAKYPKARMNGTFTIDENIADYGAYTIVYRAFTELYDRTSKATKEKRLPGLHGFNEKQMFWLSAASNWCQKTSPDFESEEVDEHAPQEFRVDGQLVNMPEFARDFNCPQGSPMNPKEKCSW